MTWNNYTEEEAEWMKNWSERVCTRVIIAKEIGGREGTPHLQIALGFRSQVWFSALKKILPKCHIEKMKGRWEHSVLYCSKEEVYFYKEYQKPKIRDLLAIDEMYKWQEKILDLLAVRPDRSNKRIIWLYDQKGRAGKTSLARFICAHNNNVLYLNGGYKDMLFGFWLFHEQCKKRQKEPRMVIINYTRITNEEFVSYEGIETLDDGIMYNLKYKSRMLIFNYVWIVVLANFAPRMEFRYKCKIKVM